MKLKTLLLGSAAAFAVVGGAQAADLSVAEPVDYVKVCDAFGVGYWYIPGTDTCLKIGGYVRFDVLFHDATDVYYNTPTHSATWEFVTEAQVTVTAKSMTEYGPLTGFVALNAQSNNNHYSNSNWVTGDGRDERKMAYLDTAWIEFGPLTVGRLASAYDFAGAQTFDGASYDSDAAADQVRLSWAMSGFGLMLGIEDPRDRWGSSLSLSYSMPNIVAAITTTQGHWSGKLSVGYAETTSGSGFGIQAAADIKLDQIAAGDLLRLKFAWAQGQVAAFATAPSAVMANGTSIWTALVSFKHFWSSQLYSAVTYMYVAPSVGATTWSLFGNLVWAPVANFYGGIEVGHTVAGTAAGVWSAKVRLQRSW